METQEVQVQEFDGIKYFLYDTLMTETEIYQIFAQLENPKEILVAKEISENGEEYYEVVEEEKQEEVLVMYQEQKGS